MFFLFQPIIAPTIPTTQPVLQTYVHTDNADFDKFYERIKSIMTQNIRQCQNSKGYRSPDTDNLWLRDHVYQMRAFKYWETDMTSLVDFFLQDQSSSGSFNDLVCPNGRIGTEADVEYLAVLGAINAWQTTGNDEWLFSISDILEKGLTYSITDKNRWSSDFGLVKRPFTIDTWDFQWGDGSPEINENTRFGILSGDNSGFYLAARNLAQIFSYKKEKTRANYWNQKADEIRIQSQKYLWNNEKGYFKSFFHIETPFPIPEVDEDEILSFSNILNVNRGDFVDDQKAESVIEEYQLREKWYSINPDYGENKFGKSAQKSGEYVNGGIFPFVGGEIAMAALTRGFEKYGVDQIKKYIELLDNNNNKTYLWYWPDGRPGIYKETISTDGWGSGAFLAAFVEGLVGVRDLERTFRTVELAPRWPAAEINHADVKIAYGASNAYIGYEYDNIIDQKKITLQVNGSGNFIKAHVLLPTLNEASKIIVNNKQIQFSNSKIRDSIYADFKFETPASVSIFYDTIQSKTFVKYQQPGLVNNLNKLTVVPKDVKQFEFSPNGEYLKLKRNLVRAAGHEEVYFITSKGTKMHIPNPEVFAKAGFSFKDVWIISQDELNNIPDDTLPFDVKLVKNNKLKYLIIAGCLLIIAFIAYKKISANKTSFIY